MPLVVGKGFVDLRLLSFTLNNTPITLHYFVHHDHTNDIDAANFFFILRQVDQILRLTATDAWTFSSNRSEQSIRTVINQVAGQGFIKMCTIEELRALKSTGLLSHRAQKMALIDSTTLIKILRHFNHDIHALVIEAILITLLAEQRFLRNTLLYLKSAVYQYNEQLGLPHDYQTTYDLLANMSTPTPLPLSTFTSHSISPAHQMNDITNDTSPVDIASGPLTPDVSLPLSPTMDMANSMVNGDQIESIPFTQINSQQRSPTQSTTTQLDCSRSYTDQQQYSPHTLPALSQTNSISTSAFNLPTNTKLQQPQQSTSITIPYPPPWSRYFGPKTPVMDLRLNLLLTNLLRDPSILRQETTTGIWNSLILPVSRSGHVIGADGDNSADTKPKRKYAKKGRDLNVLEPTDIVTEHDRGLTPVFTLVKETEPNVEVCPTPSTKMIKNTQQLQQQQQQQQQLDPSVFDQHASINNNNTDNSMSNYSFGTNNTNNSQQKPNNQLQQSQLNDKGPRQLEISDLFPNQALTTNPVVPTDSYDDTFQLDIAEDGTLITEPPSIFSPYATSSIRKNVALSQCVARITPDGESIITCTDVFPINPAASALNSINLNNNNGNNQNNNNSTNLVSNNNDDNNNSTPQLLGVQLQYRSSSSEDCTDADSSRSSSTMIDLSSNSNHSSDVMNEITHDLNRLSLETVIQTKPDHTSLTLSYPESDDPGNNLNRLTHSSNTSAKNRRYKALLQQPPKHATFSLTIQNATSPTKGHKPLITLPTPQIPLAPPRNPLNRLITKNYQNQVNDISTRAVSTFTLLPQTLTEARDGVVHPFLQFTHRPISIPLLLPKFHPATLNCYICPHFYLEGYPQFLLKHQKAHFLNAFPLEGGPSLPSNRNITNNNTNNTNNNNNNDNCLVSTYYGGSGKNGRTTLLVPSYPQTTSALSQIPPLPNSKDDKMNNNDDDDDEQDDYPNPSLDVCIVRPNSISNSKEVKQDKVDQDVKTTQMLVESPLQNHNDDDNNSNNKSKYTSPTQLLSFGPGQYSTVEEHNRYQNQVVQYQQAVVVQCYKAMRIMPIDLHSLIPLPHSQHYHQYQEDLQQYQHRQLMNPNGTGNSTVGDDDVNTTTTRKSTTKKNGGNDDQSTDGQGIGGLGHYNLALSEINNDSFQPREPLARITALNQAVQFNLLKTMFRPSTPVFTAENIIKNFHPEMMRPIESDGFCLDCLFASHEYLSQFPPSNPTLRYISKYYAPRFQSPCWCKQRDIGMKYPHQSFGLIPVLDVKAQSMTTFASADGENDKNDKNDKKNKNKSIKNNSSKDQDALCPTQKEQDLQLYKAELADVMESAPSPPQPDDVFSASEIALGLAGQDEMFQLDPDFLTFAGIASFPTIIALSTIYYRQRHPPPPIQPAKKTKAKSYSLSMDNVINTDGDGGNNDEHESNPLDPYALLDPEQTSAEYLTYTTTILRESFKWLVQQLKSPVVFSTALVEFDDKANAEIHGIVQLDNDGDDSGMLFGVSQEAVPLVVTTKSKKNQNIDTNTHVPPLYIMSDLSPAPQFRHEQIQKQQDEQLKKRRGKNNDNNSTYASADNEESCGISKKPTSFLDSINPQESLVDILTRQLQDDLKQTVLDDSIVKFSSDIISNNFQTNLQQQQQQQQNHTFPLLPQPMMHQNFPYTLKEDNIALFRSWLFHLEVLPPCVKLRLLRHACMIFPISKQDSVMYPDGSYYGVNLASTQSSQPLQKLTTAQLRKQQQQARERARDGALNEHDTDLKDDEVADDGSIVQTGPRGRRSGQIQPQQQPQQQDLAPLQPRRPRAQAASQQNSQIDNTQNVVDDGHLSGYGVVDDGVNVNGGVITAKGGKYNTKMIKKTQQSQILQQHSQQQDVDLADITNDTNQYHYSVNDNGQYTTVLDNNDSYYSNTTTYDLNTNNDLYNNNNDLSLSQYHIYNDNNNTINNNPPFGDDGQPQPLTPENQYKTISDTQFDQNQNYDPFMPLTSGPGAGKGEGAGVPLFLGNLIDNNNFVGYGQHEPLDAITGFMPQYGVNNPNYLHSNNLNNINSATSASTTATNDNNNNNNNNYSSAAPFYSPPQHNMNSDGIQLPQFEQYGQQQQQQPLSLSQNEPNQTPLLNPLLGISPQYASNSNEQEQNPMLNDDYININGQQQQQQQQQHQSHMNDFSLTTNPHKSTTTFHQAALHRSYSGHGKGKGGKTTNMATLEHFLSSATSFAPSSISTFFNHSNNNNHASSASLPPQDSSGNIYTANTSPFQLNHRLNQPVHVQMNQQTTTTTTATATSLDSPQFMGIPNQSQDQHVDFMLLGSDLIPQGSYMMNEGNLNNPSHHHQ